MECENCGHPVGEKDDACPECGAPLKQSAPMEPPEGTIEPAGMKEVSSSKFTAAPTAPGSAGGKKRSSRMWLWIVIAAIVVVAIIVAILVWPKSSNATVPQLIGLSGAQAQQKATDAGLVYASLGAKYAPSVAPGTVVLQYPVANTEVAKNSTVSVFVSINSKQVTVPNVVGQMIDPVIAGLQQAGLIVGTVEGKEGSQPLGTVTAQNPAAGAQVDAGTAVALVVSTGPSTTTTTGTGSSTTQAAQVTLPHLIGLQKNTALTILSIEQLKGTAVDVDSDRPVGEVVDQKPVGGTSVNVGSEVVISVSNGKTAPSTSATTAPPATTTTTAAPTTTTTAAPTTTTTAAPTTTTAAASTTTTLPNGVVYQADWSSGMNGWVGPADWSVSNAQLKNSGAGAASGTLPSPILAPYTSPTADYSVQTTIQLLPNFPDWNSFGIVVRAVSGGGYVVGVSRTPITSDYNLFLANPGAGENIADHILAGAAMTVGTTPHVYRVDVTGSAIRVWVDNRVMLQAEDTKFAGAGQMGLWSAASPVVVTKFSVLGP